VGEGGSSLVHVMFTWGGGRSKSGLFLFMRLVDDPFNFYNVLIGWNSFAGGTCLSTISFQIRVLYFWRRRSMGRAALAERGRQLGRQHRGPVQQQRRRRALRLGWRTGAAASEGWRGRPRVPRQRQHRVRRPGASHHRPRSRGKPLFAHKPFVSRQEVQQAHQESRFGRSRSIRQSKIITDDIS